MDLCDDIDLPDDAGLVIPGFDPQDYVARILPWYTRVIGKPDKVAPAWEGGGTRITKNFGACIECNVSLIAEPSGVLRVQYACPWDYAPSSVSFGLASETSLREALNKVSQIIDKFKRTRRP